MGLVMMIFGVSETSAHAVVSGIWLLGVLAWYLWISRLYTRLLAFIVGLALISMPVVVLWGRSIMLEAPAVGMCALSVYFFQRFLERPSHASSILVGLSLFTTLMIKQTTLFIVPVLLIYSQSLHQRRKAICRKESLWAVLGVVLAMVIIALHALLFGPEAVMSGKNYAASGSPELWTWARWGLYAQSIHEGAGSLLSILAIVGIALAAYRPERYIVLPFAWLVAAYLWCTYLSGVPANNARYAFYAMPAVAFFSAYGIWHFKDIPVLKWGWVILILVAVGLNTTSALQTAHRYVSGYDTAARFVYGLPNSGTILFAGKHDGNFIFHLHKLDRERKRVVLRGDKTLVEMSVAKYFGVKSHVRDQSDVRSLLNKNAVRWIVVESRDLVGLKEIGLLHKTLSGPGYRLLARFPVGTNVDEFKDLEVRVYENLDLVLPVDGRVRIAYPYLGKTYEFTFSDRR